MDKGLCWIPVKSSCKRRKAIIKRPPQTDNNSATSSMLLDTDVYTATQSEEEGI